MTRNWALLLVALALMGIILLPQPEMELTPARYALHASALPAQPSSSPPGAMQLLTAGSGPPERGGYTFFSTDFHISPIADIADVFRSLCTTDGLCMTVEEHSFSGACAQTFGGRRSTCATGLRVVTKANAFDLCPRPLALRRAFFDAYRGPASPLQHVDAFVCNHPPAMCELYMPFNKSILIVASVNLEFSRENPARWRQWLDSLRRIAANPRNVVAANNLYDAEYIRYFAGVRPLYLPSYCGYVTQGAAYRPDFSKPVLFARNHNNPKNIFDQAHRAVAHETPRQHTADRAPLAAARLQFVRTEDAFPGRFEYSEVARHPAVVIVPYTKSVMSFFELYRLNIPIFAPSLKLLVKWERDYSVLAERIYWKRAPRPVAYEDVTALSPNTRAKPRALRHWLALCDFYQFPNVTYFDSWEELLGLLRSAPLNDISAAMSRANDRQLTDIRSSWRQVFKRMFRGEPPGARRVPQNYDAAMTSLYGAGVLPGSEPSCQRQSRPEFGEWG